MKAKKAAVILIVLVFAANLLCGCKLVKYIKNEEPSKIVKYVNEDYHFTLTHPSEFSKVEEKKREDNDDEITIKLMASEEDFINIDIRYKNEEKDSSASLYDYIIGKEFDKQRLVFLSTNSFAYDDRESEEPAYYIYAGTKRMIYIISYAHRTDNENEQSVIDSLEFSFDEYANLPKENAMLSPPYKYAYGLCTFKALANADVSFDFEPTYDENGAGDYRYCRKLTAEAQKYKAVFSCPLMARYNYFDFDTVDLNVVAPTLLEELCPGLENIEFDEAAENKIASKKYKIINFSCTYNGEYAFCSLSIGFSTLNYFENVCIITDTATDAEIRNFTDMIESFKI